jgi:hypothetical protein
VAFSPAFPQRPRVFLTCAWECASVVRVLAVRVRCEEGGRGASASVDATNLDPYLDPTSNPDPQTLRAGGGVLF